MHIQDKTVCVLQNTEIVSCICTIVKSLSPKKAVVEEVVPIDPLPAPVMEDAVVSFNDKEKGKLC